MENQNQSEYDISKSNFFANIDSEDKKNEQPKTQNSVILNKDSKIYINHIQMKKKEIKHIGFQMVKSILKI